MGEPAEDVGQMESGAGMDLRTQLEVRLARAVAFGDGRVMQYGEDVTAETVMVYKDVLKAAKAAGRQRG